MRVACISCLVALLAIAPTSASDNSKSSLEVIELLELNGSAPISYTPPPPINIRPKPPSLQVLQEQLASQQQLLMEEEQSLHNDQLQLQFWNAQPKFDPEGLESSNVANWQQAVESEQNLLNAVQAQINSLTAQIAAAK